MISIHGDSLDIEASFADDRLSDVLADAIKRAGGRTEPAKAPTVQGPIDIDFAKAAIESLDDAALRTLIDYAQAEVAKRTTPPTPA